MVPRYKKLGSQLGKKIPDPGAHMAHAAVAVLRKRRKKGADFGHVQKPGKEEMHDDTRP